MRLITINANGQILSMCKCDQLVSDSIDVLEVQFVFDSAWAGMVKTAQFTQKNKETQAFDTYNVLIDDMGMACIPNEITDGVCIISVFGVVGGQRMTTAPLAVSVLKSGFVPDGDTPIPPTPDLYQQLLAEFQASSYELPTASAEMLGGVKVGQGLTVTPDGTLSATGGGTADSVAWENVTGKPETFSPATHKHQAGDVNGLANVATTGDYNDLENRPTIPAAYELPTASADTLGGVKVGSGLSVDADGTLSATSTGGGTADSVAWENVTGKPETFSPATHKHQAGDVNGLANVATTGNYNDLNNRPTIPEPFIPPVGIVLPFWDDTEPAAIWGGVWELLAEGLTMVQSGNAYPLGSTGGEASHALTVDEMPEHRHIGRIGYQKDGFGYNTLTMETYIKSITTPLENTRDNPLSDIHVTNIAPTTETGGSKAHNNMPPYLSVNLWKRTA